MKKYKLKIYIKENDKDILKFNREGEDIDKIIADADKILDLYNKPKEKKD